MTFAADREQWFTFRSERLRTFMEAWLTAHAIQRDPTPAVGRGHGTRRASLARTAWCSSPRRWRVRSRPAAGARATPRRAASSFASSPRRSVRASSTRSSLFAEFLKARRAARGFAHHHEHQQQEREGALARRSSRLVEAEPAKKTSNA